MQTDRRQLLRQQVILRALGFYKGRLDGIWGPNSISAKKAFEADISFLPGIPKKGLPFAGTKPLPAGIDIDPATKLLYHPSIDTLLVEEEKAWASITTPVVSGDKKGKKDQHSSTADNKQYRQTDAADTTETASDAPEVDK